MSHGRLGHNVRNQFGALIGDAIFLLVAFGWLIRIRGPVQ
jgi:hypothetical protein